MTEFKWIENIEKSVDSLEWQDFYCKEEELRPYSSEDRKVLIKLSNVVGNKK